MATSDTSLGSNVGILGVCELDKPKPSLEDLRQLSEQREHARATDRLKGLKSREERNKNKFEQSKEQGTCGVGGWCGRGNYSCFLSPLLSLEAV